MAAINKIDVTITTADVADAGTDGNVYLGICGREFNLDTSANDFERHSTRTYVLGTGSNVLNKAKNDPTNPQLDSADIDDLPKYIRIEGGSSWDLISVCVQVDDGTSYGINFPKGIWLGTSSGKVVHLKKGNCGE